MKIRDLLFASFICIMLALFLTPFLGGFHIVCEILGITGCVGLLSGVLYLIVKDFK